MGLEIERKFLLSELPEWLGACRSDEIRQGYVAVEDETEVRIRQRGDDHSLTVKRGGGLVRAEVEIGLDADRFEALWPLTEGRRVLKRRYLVGTEAPGPDLDFEVDVYGGELEGLSVVEIEFPAVEASEAFEPPQWLGAEVTEDGRYKNRSLAERGRPD